jgi:2,4-dienoyl-CoA reductase (NADPH2)
MRMTPYPTLLSPLRLGAITLPNRTLMGSMHTSLEERADGPERLAAFYAARARGQAALIVTGGYGPNREGRLSEHGSVFTEEEAPRHSIVTEAVHREGGCILLQMLHAGRYGTHAECVAPSAIRAPINRHTPRALSADEVERTIEDHVACAARAQAVGYDGVEVMGSEGYLINQFVVRRTNRRDDAWGGPFENRIRFPVEIVRRMRARCGPDFIIMYRLSLIDLVEDGSTWEETARLGRAIETAGASLINSGIGWHEARIPTIAHMVPRAAWTWATRRLKDSVSIPLVTSNRINDPEVAERVLARGDADMVSMARPFLSDADFVAKAAAGRADEINTCIGCNQACLDHYFTGEVSTCLVNPFACHETERILRPASPPKRIAVVGGGPAGMAASLTLAERGHRVTLFEASDRLGGQFNMALRIPGKEDYAETIRYFAARLPRQGVEFRLGRRAEPADLAGFDAVVLATGVTPRRPDIAGIDHAKVVFYDDALLRGAPVGRRVAIVGAGGIGFDMAEFLTGRVGAGEGERDAFLAEWGIDKEIRTPGGLAPPHQAKPPREVFLLQRRGSRHGETLGRTTGWVHKLQLQKNRVRFLGGVVYRGIDDCGLHILVGDRAETLEIDTVVICAGQEPLRALEAPLRAAGLPVHRVGGADEAVELDAKRAILQAVTLALEL